MAKYISEEKLQAALRSLEGNESSHEIAKSIGTDHKAILFITYTIGSRPTYSLVSEMLERALDRLPEEHELLMHSDQGWHYQMKQYRNTLKSRGIVQSMSRKGNCYDNSVI